MPAGAASSRSSAGDAAYERISSSERGSNERRPRIIAIVTGKKVRYVAMTTTDRTPWPSANTIIGARAMIGMVWLAMTYGHERPLEQPRVDEDGRQEQARGPRRAGTRCAASRQV